MPDRRNDEPIEYLDAEPIEGTGAPSPSRQQQFQPHVHTYYQKNASCIPCCGPIGCSVILIMAFAVIGNPELLKGALYAGAILVIVSLLSQVLLGRR
jgi:hypothetical protein